MRQGAALFLVFLTAAAAIAVSPAEAVAAALPDARTLPAETRSLYRYMARPPWCVTAAQWTGFKKALTAHFHFLSREPEIVPLVEVAPGVIRVYFLDFGWERSTWEKLAVREPYFHYLDQRVIRKVRVDVANPVVVDTKLFVFRSGFVEVTTSEVREGEKVYERASERSYRETTLKSSRGPPQQGELKEEQSTKPLHAPWLDVKQIAELAILLNSDCPIVRADWFLWQTSAAYKRGGAGYYDMLGLKNLKDAQKLAGLDIEAAQRLRKEMAAIVDDSGVALNNRQVLWYKTLAGSWWQTLDADESQGKKNALRVYDGDFDAVAFEIYFSLPNGTWGLLAVNAKDGTLQDTVPDNIASDSKSESNDKRIHNGFSCIRCHVEGIRNIDDWARATYTGPVALAARDPKKLKRLQQLYLSDLPRQIKKDNTEYAEVLLKINGLTPAKNAQAYAEAVTTYFDKRLTFEDQCREIYADPKKFREKLVAYALPGDADQVLTAQLARIGRPMRREHFEEVYSLAQTIWKGGRP